MTHEILEWDSDLFGFNVARVHEPDAGQLDDVLERLEGAGVRLVYWTSANVLPEAAIRRWRGFLADHRTTFAIDLRTLAPETLSPTQSVEPYSPSMPMADLEALAIQSGESSRFAVDPQVPRDVFERLYTAWVHNSVNKTLALEVLVLPVGPGLAGMVTVGDKAGRGDIGLIAVDREYRGRHFGEALVRAAQRWFLAGGYQFAQVVTQGRNTAACNLYRKCGYSVESVEHVYHFWL